MYERIAKRHLASRVPLIPVEMTADRAKRIRELARLSDNELFADHLDELDDAAWGFTSRDLVRVPLDRIQIRYRTDYQVAQERLHDDDLFREYERALDREPVEVELRNGEYVLVDGHHRFSVAERLDRPWILSQVIVKDPAVPRIRELARRL